VFADRHETGRLLAEKLSEYTNTDTIIFAIPRGGVVVAYEVASKLNVPLDLIIPRKIGAPSQPELAIGAVAQDGTIVLNNRLVQQLGISKDYIEKESRKQIQEIERRLKKYRSNLKQYPNVKNKNVILIDDGIATGATVKAAILSLRKQKPKSIIIAIPVAPPDTIDSLKEQADKVICLETPDIFYAIGQFYQDFAQTTDDEVINLLRKSNKQVKTDFTSDELRDLKTKMNSEDRLRTIKEKKKKARKRTRGPYRKASLFGKQKKIK